MTDIHDQLGVVEGIWCYDLGKQVLATSDAKSVEEEQFSANFTPNPTLTFHFLSPYPDEVNLVPPPALSSTRTVIVLPRVSTIRQAKKKIMDIGSRRQERWEILGSSKDAINEREREERNSGRR